MTAPTRIHPERVSRRQFRSPDVMAAANITYRQLDHWTRTGLLTASGHASIGHGDARWYRDNDVVRAVTVATLARAGLSFDAIRGRIDDLLQDGQPLVDDGWVTITVDLAAIREHVAAYRRLAS